MQIQHIYSGLLGHIVQQTFSLVKKSINTRDHKMRKHCSPSFHDLQVKKYEGVYMRRRKESQCRSFTCQLRQSIIMDIETQSHRITNHRMA